MQRSSLIVSLALRFAVKASLQAEIVSYCFVRFEICCKASLYAGIPISDKLLKISDNIIFYKN